MSAVIERSGQGPRRTPPHAMGHAAARGNSRAVPSAAAILVGATSLGATLVFWLVHRGLVDDAYITLTYARTLAEHGDWGLLPGHEANSATSPLNVLLLGGLSKVVGDPVVAAGVLYVLSCVAAAVGLRGLGHAMGLGDRVAVIGTPLLVASPLLASTIGLETMLVVAAMVYLVWACVRGDAVLAGLTTGVLLWLRLDTVTIAAVLVLATPALWRRLRLVAALASAVIGPWLVFSWLALGSAIPDTLVIKQGDSWGDFATGLFTRYYERYSWAIAGLLVVAGVGIVSSLTWAWWRRYGRADSTVVPALAVAGAAYFASLWILDVPPFFWYYAPTLAALSIAAAIGLAAISGPDAGRLLRSAAVAICSGVLVLTAIPWVIGTSTQTPLRAMPIHGNWALPGEYERIGRELGAIVGDTPVRGPGEVGALAYFCECTIVDRFTDRSMIADRIENARDGSWIFDLNYYRLDTADLEPIEPGYWLVWRPGPDPTDRGWDSTGMSGGYRESGHFELLTEPPRPADHPRRDDHRQDRSTRDGPRLNGSLR